MILKSCRYLDPQLLDFNSQIHTIHCIYIYNCYILGNDNKTVAPRPASENFSKPAPPKPDQNAKGQNISQINVSANRISTGSTDSVFLPATPAKGNNSSLQVQKTSIPMKSPPACKLHVRNIFFLSQFTNELFKMY